MITVNLRGQEVEITHFNIARAEPDVGLMSDYLDDWELADENGEILEWELTEEESDVVSQAIHDYLNNSEEDFDDFD